LPGFFCVILLTVMLMGQVDIGPAECVRPNADDMRPYTLCLAETANNDVEQRLQSQLEITLAHLRASEGPVTASRLRLEQRRWNRRRNRSCAAEASEAPAPEHARAELTCLTMAAETRIERLTAIAKGS
jgi:uncharacterized protein YecT (DUF1311 family)